MRCPSPAATVTFRLLPGSARAPGCPWTPVPVVGRSLPLPWPCMMPQPSEHSTVASRRPWPSPRRGCTCRMAGARAARGRGHPPRGTPQSILLSCPLQAGASLPLRHCLLLGVETAPPPPQQAGRHRTQHSKRTSHHASHSNCSALILVHHHFFVVHRACCAGFPLVPTAQKKHGSFTSHVEIGGRGEGFGPSKSHTTDGYSHEITTCWYFQLHGPQGIRFRFP